MTLTTFLRRSALALGAGAALVFGTAWSLSTQTRPAPDTQVGFTRLPFQVAHRDKALDLHIWYPSRATGTPDLIGQNALMYGFYAHSGAAPRAGAHPLVVLSHGSGGRMTQMAWLATALAEQGYIVAGVNHHGTTSRDSDPHRTVQIWERPADLRAVIDAFETGTVGTLTADTSAVIAAGFSLGGHTALALAGAEVRKAAFIDYCAQYAGTLDCGWLSAGGVDFNDIDAARYDASFKDPRITGVIALDPALPQAMTPDSLAAINMPALMINLGDAGAIPAGVDAAQITQQIGGSTYAALAGSWHMSALGECSTLGRLIIGAADVITGEGNICGEAARHRTVIHGEALALIAQFLGDTH